MKLPHYLYPSIIYSYCSGQATIRDKTLRHNLTRDLFQALIRSHIFTVNLQHHYRTKPAKVSIIEPSIIPRHKIRANFKHHHFFSPCLQNSGAPWKKLLQSIKIDAKPQCFAAEWMNFSIKPTSYVMCRI